MGTAYPAWIRRWLSFQDNAQQMKKFEVICIFLTVCIGKQSVCFQDLPEVPGAEVVFCRETVDEKDCLVVDEASKLSLRVNCFTLACVAGKETNVQVRYTCISTVWDPGSSLRQMLSHHYRRDLRSESTTASCNFLSSDEPSLWSCYYWQSWGIFKAHPSTRNSLRSVPEDSLELWLGSPE